MVPSTEQHLVNVVIDLPEYSDQFVWDISSPDNDPFEFASQTVRDLGLAEKLVLPIALSIQRQCQLSVCRSLQAFLYCQETYDMRFDELICGAKTILGDHELVFGNKVAGRLSEQMLFAAEPYDLRL